MPPEGMALVACNEAAGFLPSCMLPEALFSLGASPAVDCTGTETAWKAACKAGGYSAGVAAAAEFSGIEMLPSKFACRPWMPPAALEAAGVGAAAAAAIPEEAVYGACAN